MSTSIEPNVDANRKGKNMEPKQGEHSVATISSVSGISELIDALRFYATPHTYHAVTILADRPAGEFFDDVSEDHGDRYYGRAMPGKLARETLTRLGIPW